MWERMYSISHTYTFGLFIVVIVSIIVQLYDALAHFKPACFTTTIWAWIISDIHGLYGIWLLILITLRPRRNEQHFADDIFKRIFVNGNVWISIKIPLKFVPKGPINNIPALVQIMAWLCSGGKPLSEPMMVSLPTHLCVTSPQWVIFNSGS